MSRREKGFSLVEMLVTITVFGIVTGAVMRVVMGSDKNQTLLEVRNKLKTYGQTAVNSMQRNVMQSRRLYGDPEGDGYIARLNLSAAPLVAPNSRLPTIVGGGSLSPEDPQFDPNCVGNSLVFSQKRQPVEISFQLGDETVTMLIDTYEFIYYYLTRRERRFGPKDFIYELIEWKSTPLADVQQLQQIENPDRANMINPLRDAGVEYAWNPSATHPDSALFLITDIENQNPTQTDFTLNQIYCGNAIKLPRGDGATRYAVSPNTGDGFALSHRVPHFAEPWGDLPGGFETLIVGPSGGRKVFINLVQAAYGSWGLTSFQSQVLSQAKDF